MSAPTGVAPITRDYYRGPSALFTTREGAQIEGTLTFQSSSAPTYTPPTGDIRGFNVSRTNTGLYLVTTTDAAPAIIGVDIEWLQATPAYNNILAIGLPVQTTTGTWQIPFSTFAANSPADPAVGDMAYVYIKLRKTRNST